MKKSIIFMLLCLLPCFAKAYDFVANGVYYNITDRWRRTVEVTHWEEQTDEGGKPRRVIHHHSCGCMNEQNHEHKSNEHNKLIQMDEAAVERERTAYIGRVVVPEVVRHKGRKYTVTGIGDGSFFRRKKLTEVVLPPTITYIGAAAFEGCISLSEIQIPPAVNRIGFAAFRRCMSLKRLQLPDSLQHVDVYAFAFCDSVTQIQIPASLDSFPGNIFFQCKGLKKIVLFHAVPPVVEENKGLTMDFRKIVFYVQEQALQLYKADAYWRKQNVQIVQSY